ELQLHRSQDLQWRRRGTHLPDLQPLDRLDRSQAPRRRPPRQALLPAQPFWQAFGGLAKARLTKSAQRQLRVAKRQAGFRWIAKSSPDEVSAATAACREATS